MGPFIRTSNDSTRNSCWVINLNLPVRVHPANIPCFFRKSIPRIQGLIRFLQTTKSFLYSFCPILNSHSVIPIGQRLLPLADLTSYVCVPLHGTPGALGVLLPWCSFVYGCFGQFWARFRRGASEACLLIC